MFRIVETSGGDINFVWATVILIGQGSAASVAKGAIRTGVRPVALRLSLVPRELRPLHRDPRYRLRAGGPATIRAMAICLMQSQTARPKAHLTAIASAGDG